MFFFNDTATTEIYTLSLHDALPIFKHNRRHLARRNAVQALYQWDITGQSVGEIEDAFINDEAFVGVQRSYFKHLIENVPRQCQLLDSQLERYISRELASIDPVERAILRLSTYELLFRDRKSVV